MIDCFEALQFDLDQNFEAGWQSVLQILIWNYSSQIIPQIRTSKSGFTNLEKWVANLLRSFGVSSQTFWFRMELRSAYRQSFDSDRDFGADFFGAGFGLSLPHGGFSTSGFSVDVALRTWGVSAWGAYKIVEGPFHCQNQILELLPPHHPKWWSRCGVHGHPLGGVREPVAGRMPNLSRPPPNLGVSAGARGPDSGRPRDRGDILLQYWCPHHYTGSDPHRLQSEHPLLVSLTPLPAAT